MSTHKYIDRICCVAIAACLVLTVILMNGESLGIQAYAKSMGYESRLFDTGTVHTIDIVMDDWEGFLDTCVNEEYSLCTVVIDGESYKNVGIRAKGNTSLTQVASYGNDRYSFKIEFDHYDSTESYYGLDKLSLNNIIQDNTYMKDYLTYQMMGYFGVDAPLCSYVYITVNGQDWGLYLAVEGVEEAFLQRNYGSDYGELYKPDSQSMGGGRGNGGGFVMDEWLAGEGGGTQQEDLTPPQEAQARTPGEETVPDEGMGTGWDPGDRSGGGARGAVGGGAGSSDVSLLYTDDEYSSYQNIFDNAKTDVTDSDKDRLIASLKQLNAGEDIEEVVNVDEVIRYFVVHNFVCNFDSYTGSMIHNYYLYEEDGQLYMIPWDYNLAFGGFQGAQDATALVNYPIDTPVSGGTVESRPMLAWIFASEEYTQLYHAYFASFIEEFFDSGYFQQTMDNVRELIAPYVEKDPTKFCTYEEFEAGADTLEAFCLLRAESVRGQLDGTIPSTSDGQTDSTVLVDASDVDISAMGSMEGAGGGMGGMPDRWTGAEGGTRTPGIGAGNVAGPAEEMEGPPGTASGETVWGNLWENTQAPGGETGGLETPPEGMTGDETPPEGAAGGWSFPDGMTGGGDIPGSPAGEEPSQSGRNDADGWIWLAVSAAVLCAAILAVSRYKKRG